MANKLRVTTKEKDDKKYDKVDLLESFCMERGAMVNGSVTR